MQYIFEDAEIVLGSLLIYFSELGQTSLFVHGAVGLLGCIILYMISYRTHVRIMLNHGVTWLWLLQGVYVVLIVGAVTGIPYNWARFEAQMPNPGQSLFLFFVLLPLVAGVWLLSSANHARTTTKISREHRKGQRDTPI